MMKNIKLSNGYEGPALKIFSNSKRKWAILDFDDRIVSTFFTEVSAQYMLKVFNNPSYYIEEIWL